MSVIVWDGVTIAADRRASSNQTIKEVHKLCLLPNGDVCGYTGSLDTGEEMIAWYKRGADPKDFPEVQRGDNWSRLVVLSGQDLFFYEQAPYPLRNGGGKDAFGCSDEAAMAAMLMGGDAIKAVEIASRVNSGCGNGCDYYNSDTGETTLMGCGKGKKKKGKGKGR